MKQWRIEEHCALIVKPSVMTPDHSKMMFWGDSVVATPNGARRLGQRPREILELVERRPSRRAPAPARCASQAATHGPLASLSA